MRKPCPLYPLRTLGRSAKTLSIMNTRSGVVSYTNGLMVVLSALLAGYLGVTFFDDFLSSRALLGWAFVSLISASGLSGAIIVTVSFWRRNRVFDRKR